MVQISDKRARIRKLADTLGEAREILLSQLDYGDELWMDSVLERSNGAGLGKDVVHFVTDIRHYEVTSRKRPTTWPRNKQESRISRNTMGYQPRFSSPTYTSSVYEVRVSISVLFLTSNTRSEIDGNGIAG